MQMNKDIAIIVNSAGRDAATVLQGVNWEGRTPSDIAAAYDTLVGRFAASLVEHVRMTTESYAAGQVASAFPGSTVEAAVAAPPAPVVPQAGGFSPSPQPAAPSTAPTAPAAPAAPVNPVPGTVSDDDLYRQLFDEIDATVNAGNDIWQGMPSFYADRTRKDGTPTTPRFKHKATGKTLWAVSKYSRPAWIDEAFRARGIVQ